LTATVNEKDPTSAGLLFAQIVIDHCATPPAPNVPPVGPPATTYPRLFVDNDGTGHPAAIVVPPLPVIVTLAA